MSLSLPFNLSLLEMLRKTEVGTLGAKELELRRFMEGSCPIISRGSVGGIIVAVRCCINNAMRSFIPLSAGTGGGADVVLEAGTFEGVDSKAGSVLGLVSPSSSKLKKRPPKRDRSVLVRGVASKGVANAWSISFANKASKSK